MNKKFYERTWFIVMCCIIFPPAGIFLIWKNKKPDKKSTRIFISVALCLWTLALAMSGSDEENAKNADKKPKEEVLKVKTEKNEKVSDDYIEKTKEDAKGNEKKKEGKQDKKLRKNKKKKGTKKNKDKERKESPFPKEENYIVNNTLFRYNEIARYPLGDKFIEDLEDVGRPLGKINLTVSNGVYFIIRYNDFNESLFIDYQEESSDDSELFVVVRDMTKAANPEVTDEDFKAMWESFQSGKYFNHYDNSFNLKDFDFIFATRVVNKGKTEYSVKSRFYINGKPE